MPKRAAGLTAASIRHAKPGRYADGNNLYLLVRSPEAKFWLFRYVHGGRRRDAGLGPAAGLGAVSLASARAKAAEWRAVLRDGRDPLADREAATAAAKAAVASAKAAKRTFADVVALYLAAHEAGWRNEKHRWQWRATLDTYAGPHVGQVPVADVATEHVMAAIEPIWATMPETATRLRGRIEAVLDFATARGWRSGDNPARWRGHIANLLPQRSKVARVEHHAALPWRDIGTFMARLRTEHTVTARGLELIILTAARTGEVLGARWPEFDLDAAEWRVPGERMKAGREHRVPLAPAAVAVLRGLLPLRQPEMGDWVLPGSRGNKPLSNMVFLMLLRRMGRGDLTAHGFRSSFRDWAAEATTHPHEVAEAALAHVVAGKVEAAYRRGDLFEKRRALMADWAAYCGPAGDAP